jgi:hypothetical protein
VIGDAEGVGVPMSTESSGSSSDPDWIASRIDTTVPHPARRYNYWLGGKDNFAADRESGDAVAAAFPTIRLAAIENRRFLRRAVTFLTREAGVRQFLDIGTGIPSADNTHDVAQTVVPESRVVYVDNDPIVLVHARALLTSSPEGATAYIDADLREPDKILNDPALLRTLDLSRPVALMLIAILHFVPDEDDPYGIVRRLIGALPSGSYLAISHATRDFMPAQIRDSVDTLAAANRGSINFRSGDELARFFDGLELVSPGIKTLSEWRAEDEPQPRPSVADIGGYGAVGRVP